MVFLFFPQNKYCAHPKPSPERVIRVEISEITPKKDHFLLKVGCKPQATGHKL
jgi:hypothetical protein